MPTPRMRKQEPYTSINSNQPQKQYFMHLFTRFTQLKCVPNFPGSKTRKNICQPSSILIEEQAYHIFKVCTYLYVMYDTIATISINRIKEHTAPIFYQKEMYNTV